MHKLKTISLISSEGLAIDKGSSVKPKSTITQEERPIDENHVTLDPYCHIQPKWLFHVSYIFYLLCILTNILEQPRKVGRH